ncbi:MAG: hypothetical protein KDG51_12425, partial [Calditrichaeota bacterium]|nr:hypothetical protein [Calditrichota bacterium]
MANVTRGWGTAALSGLVLNCLTDPYRERSEQTSLAKPANIVSEANKHRPKGKYRERSEQTSLAKPANIARSA